MEDERMAAATLVQRLERRLEALQTERASGEKMLADLAARQLALRETMLRISGAIQVLEEELAGARRPDPDTARTTGGANALAGTPPPDLGSPGP